MKPWQKISLFFTLLLIALIFVALSWYKSAYSMRPAVAFEVRSIEMPYHLLIATQGSSFKEALVLGILDHFKSKPVYIKVIDIAGLKEIQESEWRAILIIHTWENWKPPVLIKDYFAQPRPLNKMVIVTTSGSGHFRMENIDAITSASAKSELPIKIQEATAQLEKILQIDETISLNNK